VTYYTEVLSWHWRVGNDSTETVVIVGQQVACEGCSVTPQWPHLTALRPRPAGCVVILMDLINPSAAGSPRRISLMARWLPEHQVYVASECLVGSCLLLQPGNMAKDSISAVQDNAGYDGRAVLIIISLFWTNWCHLTCSICRNSVFRQLISDPRTRIEVPLTNWRQFVSWHQKVTGACGK